MITHRSREDTALSSAPSQMIFIAGMRYARAFSYAMQKRARVRADSGLSAAIEFSSSRVPNNSGVIIDGNRSFDLPCLRIEDLVHAFAGQSTLSKRRGTLIPVREPPHFQHRVIFLELVSTITDDRYPSPTHSLSCPRRYTYSTTRF